MIPAEDLGEPTDPRGDRAKTLRRQQAAMIEEELSPVIPEWAHDLDEAATHPA